ncbi:MAG: hemerythrin domain-containing protein [Ramlibacter sp.]|nr:hemerythrin domain-containing protein [Ramlibacter sp.]
MIRLDHTHVMAVFHKYEPSLSARVRKGLADQICLAVEVHAQLEEEIFYPAMRRVSDDESVKKSEPEHQEIKALIATLRGLDANHAGFDRTLYELMQKIVHHVADEETVLLPRAEKMLTAELDELGGQMTRRRLQLIAPRTPQLASGMARSMRGGTMLAALGAVLVGALLLSKRDRLRQTADFGPMMKQARWELKKRKLMAQARSMMPGRTRLQDRLMARLP